MKVKKKSTKLPPQAITSIYYLLNDYTLLLEYLIEVCSKGKSPVFGEAHVTVFREKLGLVEGLLDVVNSANSR